ncbi:MAG: Ig-like domain-containing protein [Gemmatimonadaceae bacterium]|nr:Ig-like domain-containing protein [Gemmatimonadaceae bacterium]
MRTRLVWIVAPIVVLGCDGSTAPPRTNVKTVAISPAEDQVTGINGTLVFSATVTDTLGRPVVAPEVTWKSADPTKVSLSASTGTTVTATGHAAASAVVITATSGGRSGQVKVTVTDAEAPHVASMSANPLRPGLTGVVVTGSGFGATPGANTVTIDGVAATVTAASATQLTLDVPSDGFDCLPLHSAQVHVTANGIASTSLYPLDAGNEIALGTGAVTITGPGAQLDCAELAAPAGSKYLVGLINTDANTSHTIGLTVTAASDSALGSVARRTSVPPPALLAAPPFTGPRISLADAFRRVGAAKHARLLQVDRALLARRGGPRAVAARARARMARLRKVNALRTAGAPVSRSIAPNLNDTLSFHIRDIDNDDDCTLGVDVKARAVYIGSKSVLFEDVNAPLKGTIDAFYQQIGQEFDDIIYPMLDTTFGDPLAWDASLGQNGKVVMLFSPVLNNSFGGVAGFVSACDFFPYDTTTGPDQDLVSNDAAIFYAYVPTTTNETDQWKAFIRGVLAHESKHLSSYAAKFANNADSLEDAWLEEATAQTSSEIYQRHYSGTRWKVTAPYLTSVGCEPPLTSANHCSGDHPQVMLHHFSFLYDYLDAADRERPIGDNSETYYGGAWSFVRWAVDQYAPSERLAFFTMTQAAHTFGLPNLLAQTGDVGGDTFESMVEKWWLASALAAYPPAGVADPKLQFPSWDQRGIFAGMHDQLAVGGGNEPAFPSVYPLVPHALDLASFSLPVTLRGGGGASFYELSGSRAARRTFSVRAAGGGSLDAGSPVRLAIVRVD